jgi:predicted dehydrogenase
MKPIRVGIVGGRRSRQGLAPFVARDLVAAGASVPCFFVTREENLEPARRGLRESAGIEPRGYVLLERMLEQEPLDALAILSPAETHARALELAAERGLHALCEKPLVWDLPDLADGAARIVERFEARRLLLVENCQWPFALPAFEALHPGALAQPPRRFEMLLQPASRGLQSLADSLPHPISLLQALLPGAPRIETIEFSTREPADRLELRFRWRTDTAACDARVVLLHGAQQPRRAEFELDGRRARRVVSAEGYRLCFADALRSVSLPDPLTQLVAGFVGALREGCVPSTEPILQRMRVLAAIRTSYEEKR